MNKTIRPIYEIASDVKSDWGTKMYFGAKPYWEAMLSLTTINDMYGCDTAKSIILYFLANVQTWRGEKAKAIKGELKQLIGMK